MLGFHRRARSLISVKELAKYDKLPSVSSEEELELSPAGSRQQDEVDLEMAVEAPTANRKQLALICVIFLAEAIVASGVQPQLKMLVANEDFCGTLSTTFLRSILDCAYAFGGTAGVLWGCLADRVGRRRVALCGLFGMVICSFLMGFATDVLMCAVLRFINGLLSSSVVVCVLSMMGDLSPTPNERVKIVSMLPLIGVCGSIGPVLQGMVVGSLNDTGAIWQHFPLLSSQIACGLIVFIIAIVAAILLEETLPSQHARGGEAMDSEKAAFLDYMHSASDSEPSSPTIQPVDAAQPAPISISQFLQAPSLLVLLSSYSLLSLHASTFDVVLPQLGHTGANSGGMGIPCSWLGFTVLAARAVSGLVLVFAIPKAVQKYGLLPLYRSCSLFFPAIYVVTPVFAYALSCSDTLMVIVSSLAILIKHMFAGSAQVLVALLMLNASPDPFSTSTLVGLMQIASLFKALAVAVSGASYYLSSEISVESTSYTLWTSLAVFGAIGAASTWFVRERPSLEKDYPSEALCWETCFDAEGAAAARTDQQT